MKSFIQITRHLYEEPYHLNLVIIADNGLARGHLELYLTPDDLRNIGEAIAKLSPSTLSEHILEKGSENADDNFGFYFLMRIYPTKRRYDDFAIQLRFNNNETNQKTGFKDNHQLTDFSIRLTLDSLKGFGQKLIEFSELSHQRLYWTDESCVLDNDLIGKDDTIGETVANAFASLPT